MVRKQCAGRALLKKPKQRGPYSDKHTLGKTEDNSRLPIRSITEETSLSEFFSIAKLANSDFTAQKKSFRFLSKDEISGLPSLESRLGCSSVQRCYADLLKVPRRPSWNRKMSPEELNVLENEEFLKWRRSLAELEAKEGIILTPFEKNLDFWRQMWRVVERSDVLVQIVDARQPLLYYCADLERYAHEVDPNKVCLLLINKADLLTQEQRLMWYRYFKAQSINAIFWSATCANDMIIAEGMRDKVQLSNEASSASSIRSADEGEESDSTTKDEVDESDQSDFEEPSVPIVAQSRSSSDSIPVDSTENSQVSVVNTEAPADEFCLSSDDQNCCLRTATELLDLLSQVYPPDRPRLQGLQLTVGFVGYPNVGKSSTLNALLGSKKTAVSATPGRTKHFQTLFVRPDLMLCDCPGLVMPSFVHSKADLVVAGILSIDEMRDCLSPIGLICQQIPRSVLEFKYGIDLTRPRPDTLTTADQDSPPTPHELLAAHALSRSYMATKGNPHYDRSARVILKDYVQGRLLYCHPPPGVDPKTFQSLGREEQTVPPSLSYAGLNKSSGSHRRKANKSNSDLIAEFDQLAFQTKAVSSHPHIRSRKKLLTQRSVEGQVEDGDDSASVDSSSSWTTINSSVGGSSLLFGTDCTSWTASATGDQKRPWRLLSHSKRADPADSSKPGHTKKRKEKLRRVYRHLDQHAIT